MKRRNTDISDNSSFMSKRRRLSSSSSDVIEIIEITDDERELSPADSGFKEPTLSLRSTSPTNAQTSIINLEIGLQQRGSNRIKKLQEEDQKLTETERLLKQTLRINNLIHPLETLPEAMCRLNPKVNCKKLTSYEIIKRVHLSHIVPKVQDFPSEIEFRGVILHKWRNYDGQHPHYFVRWIPMNILDDEWVIADYAKLINLKKKVKLSELNCRQRREVCERIFKGLEI